MTSVKTLLLLILLGSIPTNSSTKLDYKEFYVIFDKQIEMR